MQFLQQNGPVVLEFPVAFLGSKPVGCIRDKHFTIFCYRSNISM